MKFKVQLLYKSGRTSQVEVDGYQSITEMIQDMATSTFYIHEGGAENMLEVERIKPLNGTPRPYNEIKKV